MIEVTSEVAIARPAEDVFAFLADAENNPRWQRGMRSCRWTSDGPIDVGSTFPITVTRSVEPHGEGSCLARARVSGDPSKVLRVAAPAMRWMVQRSVRADYARLKALLEA